MTTVTEAIRLVGAATALKDSSYDRIRAEPALAAKFASEITEAAREATGGKRWSPEEVAEILRIATEPPADEPAVLEGRYFRKRLRQHARAAERTGGAVSVMVFTLRAAQDGAYAALLEALGQDLRREDTVFLYRRRLSVVLPGLGAAFRPRVVERFASVAGAGLERVSSESFPTPRFENELAFLTWAEDQLRDQPIDE
ncbi:MAG: hypothetical protein AAF938_08995 [Myxococcota bacterium]